MAYKKIVYQNLQFFQPSNYLHVNQRFLLKWTYILTEGRNFKTFLKENCAIAFDSCYLFTKEILNMELNIVLIRLKARSIPRNCRKRRKSRKWRKILNLCLRKISRQKAVRIKFSVDSAFSNMLYGKKRKPGNAGNQQKAF